MKPESAGNNLEAHVAQDPLLKEVVFRGYQDHLRAWFTCGRMLGQSREIGRLERGS
jgi:hypothetical protein